MNNLTRAVAGLLIANIILFVAGLLLTGGDERLVVLGGLWYPANPHFAPWQLVTHMFLHGGVGHIFFNMFALVSFGRILEREYPETGRAVWTGIQ